jgi:quercetin dioxygenase-like cupin family protein
MKIEDVNFCITDWSKVKPQEYPGKSGISFWRTFEKGNIRVRVVDYSPGFLADHWCSRGHVAFVLEGELLIELNDDRIFKLLPGMSFQVADNNESHLARTDKGAKVLIID